MDGFITFASSNLIRLFTSKTITFPLLCYCFYYCAADVVVVVVVMAMMMTISCLVVYYCGGGCFPYSPSRVAAILHCHHHSHCTHGLSTIMPGTFAKQNDFPSTLSRLGRTAIASDRLLVGSRSLLPSMVTNKSVTWDCTAFKQWFSICGMMG